MADKPTKAFDELIKKIKNLSIKPEDVKESKQEKVDVPVNNNIFDDLTKDEKEGLWIWLNKEDLPQA
tara:strand:- start:202 stop:402 length:201 start_codon:yes stop_codon:yes gene_type:complete